MILVPAKSGKNKSRTAGKRHKASDWIPCKLVEHPEEMGDPQFSLIFNGFSAVEKTSSPRKETNDGYTWQKIIKRMLKTRDPDVLKQLAFDCESSMFCVRSSNLDALAAVRDLIRAILKDDQLLDKGVKKRGEP